MAAKLDQVGRRRTKVALAAIKRTFGTEEGKFGANRFVWHHLYARDYGDYWHKHFGTDSPDPARILSILQLHIHCGLEDDDGLDVFDFILPDCPSDYVLCVRFDASGEVEDISMES